MVTNTVAAPSLSFPEAPPRVDMQNSLQLFQPALLPALRSRLRELEDRKPPDQRRSVFVYSEIPVRPVPTLDYTRLFVPDLTVAFDVDMETFERDERLAESARADAAEARARQLEEKLRRLQG